MNPSGQPPRLKSIGTPDLSRAQTEFRVFAVILLDYC